MTKKKVAAPEPLTEYAEDQMRRLREFVETHPLDAGFCATASGPDSLPPIWQGLADSGHVKVQWSGERVEARVKPA